MKARICMHIRPPIQKDGGEWELDIDHGDQIVGVEFSEGELVVYVATIE